MAGDSVITLYAIENIILAMAIPIQYHMNRLANRLPK